MINESAADRNIIIFLCHEKDIERERKGYADAFARLGYEVVCSGEVTELKGILNKYNNRIFAIIQPEGYAAIHPTDILDIAIPTIIFQWDTYSRTSTRARASLPYDIKIVCHPGYEKIFEEAGCKNTFLISHSVDDHLIGSEEAKERTLEVGWVGRFDGNFYKLRRQVLKLLEVEGFRTNNVGGNYSWHEMIGIYKQSKIVVNISRDDYLQDANLRCFEAMGSGALVITKLPSELTGLNFVDGRDFVGFESFENLKDLIRYYLDNNEKRFEIANNGQKRVLANHTYIKNAQNLIALIKNNGSKAMRENKLRMATREAKLQAIAYSYYKDSDLQKMFHCLILANKRPSFNTLWLVLRLFLVKYKRILS